MRSRERSYKKWRKSENEQPSYCFAGFWTCRRCYLRPLGHYFGASWRHDSPSWRHVGLCWAILSHLGAISRHLGNQDGDNDCQDVPTWSAMWSPKAVRPGGGCCEKVPTPPPRTPPPYSARGHETHLDAAKVLALSGIYIYIYIYTCTARDRKAPKKKLRESRSG